MSQEKSIVPAGGTYTGARATPELVGRQNVLDQIKGAIRDKDHPYIIYITGEGGIGKTHLTKHILKHPLTDVDVPLKCAKDLIDLYHTSTHTAEGLISAIQLVLSPQGEGFEPYLKERAKLDEYTIRRPDEAEELRKQREVVVEAFLEDFKKLCDEYRVVLVLDTVEKLYFPEDPFARRLGQAENLSASVPEGQESRQGEVPPWSLTADIRNWLVESFLPDIRNAVVVLAGRPEPETERLEPGSLTRALEQIPDEHPDIRFVSIALQGLTEIEALQYFDAVIRSAEASRDLREAKAVGFIKRLPEDLKKIIFYSFCDEGKPSLIRPILLALAIDHLVVAGEYLEGLPSSLEKAKALSSDRRTQYKHELKEALMQSLRVQQRPADEILDHLGWLVKGADVDLLARITVRDPSAIEEGLKQIKGLSFVKVRPADNRVFLHDEMYSLIKEYGLDPEADPEHERVFDALRAYYKEQIADIREEIAKLYSPLTETASTALPKMAQIIAAHRERLQDALVEDLYYRLRWDASEGFQTYFRYAEEAIAANDKRLDAQLRAELLGHLRQDDDSLRRADVYADESVRRIKRMINDVQYDMAKDEFDKLASEKGQLYKELIEPGGELAVAELYSWGGLATTHLAAGTDYDVAPQDKDGEQRDYLDQAIALLEKKRSQPSVRWAGILARAYSNRGYRHHHLRGRHKEAIDDYRQALPLWEDTQIEVEQANTLNLLADALAEVGNFDTARHLAQAGLKLRERVGPRSPVGESLLTLAYIEIRMKRLDMAKQFAEQARVLFKRLENDRGLGLAFLRLAQIELSQAEQDLDSAKPDLPAIAAGLEKAVEYAEKAETIFRKKVKEPARLVEAMIEIGRAKMEWARFKSEYPGVLTANEDAEGQRRKEELESDSEDVLRAAADHGERHGIHKQVDALLNLAWLLYYTKLCDADDDDFDGERVDLRVRWLDRIELIIRGKYPVEKYLLTPSEETPRVSSQVQLGTLELLRGQIEFDRYIRSKKEQKDALRQAARHFTLALIYYTQFSDRVFRDMGRAMDRIELCFRPLSVREKIAVYEAVAELEKERELGESRMRKFLQDHFGPEESLIPFEL